MYQFVLRNTWRSWRFWLMAAIVTGMAWRLTDYFLRFPVWNDEASLGLNILHRSYAGLLQPLRYQQVCPIGFLWAGKFMMQCFGTDVWVIRLLPLVAGLAAVLLAWPIFKSLAGRRVGLVATALLACSLATNRFGTDFKPYSLDLLLALGLIGLTLRAIRKPHDMKPVLGLALLTPVAIVFSYPSVFVIGAALAALCPVIWRGRNWLIKIIHLLWVGLAGGCFAAFYFGVIRGQMSHTHSFMQDFWHKAFPPHSPAILIWLINAHLSNMMSYPFGGSKGIALLITPLVLLGLLRLWHKRRHAEIILLAGPFVLTFLAAFLHKYPYGADARVEQHLVPSIVLLAALGAVTLCAMILRKSHNERIWCYCANISVAVMVIFAIIMIGKDIAYPWRSPAPKLARQFIARVFNQATPRTRIVILNAHPYHYSVLLAWQLATQRHPFSIGPDFAKAFGTEATGDLWVMRFNRHATPIAPQLMNKLKQRVPHGRITTDINTRIYEPFTGLKTVYMQAVHIETVRNKHHE